MLPLQAHCAGTRGGEEMHARAEAEKASDSERGQGGQENGQGENESMQPAHSVGQLSQGGCNRGSQVTSILFHRKPLPPSAKMPGRSPDSVDRTELPVIQMQGFPKENKPG